LTPKETEQAIRLIKEFFQTNLAFELNLMRVTAPIIVRAGTGVNDDLNGIEKPVSFLIRGLDGERVEIEPSLAQWKRMAMAQLGTRTATVLRRHERHST
jgi:aspartate--ammonia ligase